MVENRQAYFSSMTAEILQTTWCTDIILVNLVKWSWETFYFEYVISLKEGKNCIIFGLGKYFIPVLMLDSAISSCDFIAWNRAWNRSKCCDLRPVYYSIMNHIFLPSGIYLRKQFNLISCLKSLKYTRGTFHG